jgi:alpha-galactosidase
MDEPKAHPDRKKIVLIGAGSAMFTQGLVADLINSHKNWKLGLVDIDPQALKVAEGLSRKMIEATRADIQVEASLERKELLPGADVVVTTIGVGGRRAWEADVYIPRKYGIYQPVGDTTMAGGISRALRLVPAMVDIARDVQRLCPHALFINYANPMSVICWAVRQATGAEIIGLCIGVYEVIHELADFIGKPRSEVSALAAGLNHFTWVYDVRWKGQDAWPLVRAQLAKERMGQSQRTDTGWAGQADAPKAANNPFSWSLFDTYGAYPAVNDRHVSEFFPERFPRGMCFGRQLGVDVYSFEDCIAFGDQIYEEMSVLALGESPVDAAAIQSGLGEHSQLVQIIDSLDTDGRMNFSANLPNRGAVPNLPVDAILELTSVATGRGVRPLHVPDFPGLLAAPLIRKIAAQRLTVEAALQTGAHAQLRRELFIEALLMDGCVADAGTAQKLADELLEAQIAYLP